MNPEAENSPRFFNPHEHVDITSHHLPHWDQGSVYYFVTWRLADSLPAGKLREYQEEKRMWLARHPPPWDERLEAEYHEHFGGKIEEWLDAGSGSCVLRDAHAAGVVADSVRFFDGIRYALECFVIMPNHVHVLFALPGGHRLADVLKSWKSFSSRKINEYLKREGVLWQADSWDRIIRGERHFAYCRDYIRKNPTRAGLRANEYYFWERGQGRGQERQECQERGSPDPRNIHNTQY